MKQEITRRDAIMLVALATAALLVRLIFFTPPVLGQDNWVRLGDENRRVQALSLVVWDGALQEARYTVLWDDGTMKELWRPAAGKEYGILPDTRTQEGGSKLTMAQAAELVRPLWKLTAEGDRDNATIWFIPPNRVKENPAAQRQVNLQLSISTGRAVAVGYDAGEPDYGVMQISTFNDALTDGMGLFVQLVP